MTAISEKHHQQLLNTVKVKLSGLGFLFGTQDSFWNSGLFFGNSGFLFWTSGLLFWNLGFLFFGTLGSFFKTQRFLLCWSSWISCEYYEDYHAVMLPSLGPRATGRPIHLLQNSDKNHNSEFLLKYCEQHNLRDIAFFHELQGCFYMNFCGRAVMNGKRINSDF